MLHLGYEEVRAQCTQHHADRERPQKPLNLACKLVVVVASEDSCLKNYDLHEDGAELAKSGSDAVKCTTEFGREGFCWDLEGVSGFPDRNAISTAQA